MAFTPYSGATNKIGAIGTSPVERGLTTQEFKDKFDEFADEFVAWFNTTHLEEVGAAAQGNFLHQAIIDGNFQVAQAVPVVGTEITNPASGQYPVLDMWQLYAAAHGGAFPTTIKHSQQQMALGELPGSKHKYRIDVNGAGSGFGANALYQLYTHIEDGLRLMCEKFTQVTLSFYARSTIPGKRLGVMAIQNYGTGGSPTAADNLTGNNFILTSGWQKFTVTFNIVPITGKTFGTNNDSRFIPSFCLMWGDNFKAAMNSSTVEDFGGTGVIEIAQVQLSAGDKALPFYSKTFAEELRDCMRYFEKSYNYGVPIKTIGVSEGIETKILPSNTVLNFQPYGKTSFKVKKRIKNPSVTIYPCSTPDNTGRVSNSSGVDLAANSGNATLITDDGFTCANGSGGSLTTTLNCVIFNWTADARF